MYNVWGYRNPWLPRLLARHVDLAEATLVKKNNLSAQIFDQISVIAIDGGCPVDYTGAIDATDLVFKD